MGGVLVDRLCAPQSSIWSGERETRRFLKFWGVRQKGGDVLLYSPVTPN